MKKIIYTAIAVSMMFSSDLLASREYYNYELKSNHTVVYRGQTNNPHRRELEHAREGIKFTHMLVKGNAKTLQGARKVESKSLKTYRLSHNGKNPKYNKTRHG